MLVIFHYKNFQKVRNLGRQGKLLARDRKLNSVNKTKKLSIPAQLKRNLSLADFGDFRTNSELEILQNWSRINNVARIDSELDFRMKLSLSDLEYSGNSYVEKSGK